MQNRKSCLILVSLIIFIINISTMLSLNSLTGRVTDKQTGKPLPRASIKIIDSKTGTISDKEGYFKLSGIKHNEIQIIISFLGYNKYKTLINFNNNPQFSIDVKMEQGSESTDEIFVEAKSEGKVKAMLDRKNAENIKEIVSSEQIQQFPDMNAAESMQRIPGITLQRDQGEGRYVQLRGTPPELTNFNINGLQIPSPEGNVRFIGMDVIPADQIDAIEISKVLTPDMDADGIAGTVNIITKKAVSTIPEVKATLSGGFNNIRSTNNYQMVYSYGQKIGLFGFNMNASYFQNRQGSDNLENKFEKGTFYGSQSDSIENYHIQFREVQLRYYDITRSRTALSTSFDYDIDENNNIYLRGMYNKFTDDEVRYRKIYTLDDALSYQYYLYGGINHDVRQREKNQELSTLNFGGDHKFDFMELNYQIGYAYATEIKPTSLEVAFDNPGQAIQIKFDLSEPQWPRATFPQGSSEAYAYNKYEFDGLLFSNSNVTDKNITSRIDLKFPYKIDDKSKGYLKFGGQARFKEKYRNNEAQSYGGYKTTSKTYPGTAPDLKLSTVTGGLNEQNLLNKGYIIDNMPDPTKMKEFFNYYPQFFIISDMETKLNSYGEDYKANEDVFAAYGMLRHDFDNLMFIAGLRYEKTNIDYQGNRIITNGNSFKSKDTLTDARIHEFILPQVQIKYNVSNNFNIRFAYTQTYSRPNFRDVLPYRQEDREEVRFGNPNIKYPKSNNFDLLLEKFIQGDGLISGGIFYKQIENFIFYYKLFGHEGDPSLGNFSKVEFEIPLNGNRAYVYGAEIQTQFKLDFLPGFLSNFGIYANYTYTYSAAYINKRIPANNMNHVIVFGEDYQTYFTSDEEEQIKFPGQALHTLNFALFYDDKTYYARTSLNYQDDFLSNLGADKDLDVFYGNALHLDFTANYAVTENMRIFVDLLNITNQPLKYYLGTPDRIQKQEYYSWWTRTGIKLTF